ncbi:EAP30/Vps36 family protein [Nitzschia inconspicua]|uniref:Vacuolar protein-sorting-associated protein 36 n=1 Tax=Nitzschia inconspicua TaxID=303405 RepID=A0A9K3KM36_9STRA|nr:EAP30/Vps36 family protein [Nitzschia inconspicua]
MSSVSTTSTPDWSPFYCLPKAELTPSGLLKLDTADNEVEMIRRNSLIELRHENTNDPMAPCPRGTDGPWINRTSIVLTITITTHRIVLTDSSTNDYRFIHLSNVHVVQATGGPSFQHPFGSYKIVVSTYTYGDLLLAVPNSVHRSKENRDVIFQQLEKAFVRKQWEQATRMQEQQKIQKQKQRQTATKVGVDHILSKHHQRHAHASKLADTALSGDAEQLLTQAGELLQVIQKYTVLLQKYQKSGNQDDDDAAQKLEGLLSDMGMTSALTKSQQVGNSGSSIGGGGSSSFGYGSRKRNNPALQDYYELTARQLADFLLPRFHKQIQTGQGSGIMTLTDVYCLFNRARGTNLISPEDLRQACELLGDLNLGLSQRTFPSGVIVVQLDKSLTLTGGTNNNTTTGDSIVQLCPTTALEASHVLKLSPFLAMEQLEEAERLGLVCRDVTLETIRFYPNKFLTAGW